MRFGSAVRRAVSFGFAARFAVSLTLPIFIGLLAGCGGHGSGGSQTLGNILIVPAGSSIPAGESMQLHAVHSTVQQQAEDVTSSVAWASSNASIATVSAAGMLTGVAPGLATITATLGNVTGSLSFQVNAPAMTSLAIAPLAATVPTGLTQQFTATAMLSNRTTGNVTSTVSWSVTPATVATISAGGLLTAVAPGAFTVTAASGALSVSAGGAVQNAALTAITVTPAAAVLVGGKTQQFTAIGTYSDKTTLDLTGAVTWTSSDPTVMTINASGLATVKGGDLNTSVTVTAAMGTIAGTATATVMPGKYLLAIQVEPTSSSIATGSAEQHVATAYYSDGTQKDVTSDVTWSVMGGSNASAQTASTVVSVNQGGTDQAGAPGIAQLEASLDGASSQSTVIVTAATVTALSISSLDNNFPVGSTQQLQLIGTFSDGTTQDLSINASWQSSDATIATINTTGWATGVKAGNLQFSASFGGLTATSPTFSVTPLSLVSTLIEVPYPILPIAATDPFSLLGVYSDGSIQDLTMQAVWSSSDSSLLQVSSSGLGLAVGPGASQVVATIFGKTAVAAVETVPAVLASMEILPPQPRIALATTLAMTALGFFDTGAQADVTAPAVWTSENPQILTVDATGRIKAGTVGTTRLSVSLAGVTQESTDITVTNATVAHMSLSPVKGQIAASTNLHYTATAFFTDGNFQDVSQDVAWSSSDPTVAIVDATGVAHGIKAGTVQITAKLLGASATASLTITSAVLTAVTLTPGNIELPVGVERQFSLIGSFSDGSTQDLTLDAIWLDPTPLIADVTGQGMVGGITPGQGAVSAQYGFFSAQTQITVTTATLSSISLTPATSTIRKGGSQQLTAIGIFSDGYQQNLVLNAVFASGDTSVALTTENGTVYGVGVGTTQITASYGGKSASVPFQVTSELLNSIAIAPANAEVDAGSSLQLKATGNYTDGSTGDVTNVVAWSSSDASLLAVDENGAATAAAGVTAATPVTVTAAWLATMQSATVTVEPAGTLIHPPTLQSIAVTPTSARIAAGTTQQLAAIGSYSDGSMQDLTAAVTWSSGAAFTTVTAGGLVSGVSAGASRVTATLGTVAGQATILVTAATLRSLAISPSGASFAAGASQQFTLLGTFSDDSVQELTTEGAWSSDTPAVATVTGSGAGAGLATGVAAGSAQLAASFGGSSASAAITITGPTVVSLSVTPASVSFAHGTRQQFRAIGTYSDGTVQDLTAGAVFTSSAPDTVSIASSGVATGIGVGTALITVSASGATAVSNTITVTAATLVSIAITPNTPNFANGTTQQFVAIGTFSDGTTQDLTTQAVWSSSDAQVMTISSSGLASGGSTGSVQVTASLGAISTTTGTVTVTAAALTGLALAPLTAEIAKGTTQQFTATGSFTDGSTQNLSGLVTWTSSDSSIVAVNSTGLATGSGVGSATLAAAYKGRSVATSSFGVTPAVLASIAFNPPAPSVAAGTSTQIQVIGTFSDGSTQTITAGAFFSSSNNAIATVSSSGQVAGVAPGSSTITVQAMGVTGSFSVTVTAAALVSIAITPASPASFAKGAAEQFTATGSFTDGSTQDLTTMVGWSSSNNAVVTIDANGLATGAGQGSAAVTASYQGRSATTASFSVTPPGIASIAVAPASSQQMARRGRSILPGENVNPQLSPQLVAGVPLQFAATATYSDGSTGDVTSIAVWSSSNATVATVSASGLVAGVGIGAVEIAATVGSITGSVELSVTAAPVTLTSIMVTPTSQRIAAGTKGQFSALGSYSDGSTQDLSSWVAWSTSNPVLATVTSTGLVDGLTPGQTTVTATLGPLASQAAVIVSAATLVSVAISPSGASLADGTVEQFTLTGTFSDGSTQNLTAAAVWSSLTPATVSVTPAGLVTCLAMGPAQISASYGGQTAATMAQVTPATLISVAITPLTVSFADGTAEQFHLIGTYSDGTTHDLTASASFSSSNPAVATVNGSGLATAVGVGTVTIMALAGGQTSATQSVTVTPATLVSIAITPASPSFADGTTEQFTATGTFSDASIQDLSSQVIWTSSNPSVLTISSTGLASGGTVGSAQITAALSGVNVTSGTVSVTPAVLSSLAITPATAQIAKGTTQQFTATGTFTDGSTQNLSGPVTWTSSAQAVASVTALGLATGNGVGTAQITASYQGWTASTSGFEVSPATLVSIAFNPADPIFAAGTGGQVAVIGTYSDSSTQDITASASFSSSNPASVTVSSTGVVTGVAPGVSVITVMAGGVASSFTVTVTTATLSSITITPASPVSIAKGTTEQFHAIGTYSDSSTQDLSATVSWSSSDPGAATVSSTGLATGTGLGPVQLTAAYQGKTATSASFQAVPATVASITVAPASASVMVGGAQQFTATATYTDSTTADVTVTAAWSSQTMAIATVNSTGLATGSAAGSSLITAQYGSLSGSAALTVSAAPLVTLSSIVIAPASASVAKGNTQQFTATGVYTDGSTLDLTASAAWQSSSVSVATISASGLATAVNGGTAQIWASSQGVNSVVTMTVSAATLVSLAVTPSTATLASGTSQQFTAIGTLTDGSTQDLTSSVIWSSSNSSAATISATGLAATHITGSATITAQAGSKAATAVLMVTAATVVSVQLSPSTIALPAGGVQQLLATATFTDGSSQNVTSSVTYLSSNPAVVTVDVNGKVTAVAAGSASMTAVLGSASNSVPVTISSAVLTSITIAPSSISLAAGVAQQLTATGTFSDGSTQNLTSSVSWSSSSSHVATVSTAGNVVTASAGLATVTAASGSVTASIPVTVTSAVVTAVTVSPASVTLAAGQTQQFAATATMSDGSQQTITSSVHWSVSDATRGTISNSANSPGLLTTTASGSFTVGASINSVSGSASVTVTSAALSSVAITPDPVSLPAGTTQALTVTGSYSDGSTADVTSSALWSSQSSSVAQVNASGLLSGLTAGSTTVTATVQGISNTDGVTVTNAVLQSIAISPSSPSVAAGLTTQLTATGTYSDTSTSDLTSQVQWSSSAPTVATVGASGQVTAIRSGTATLTATLNGLTQSLTLTVSSAVLQSITVSAVQNSLALGLSLQLTATGNYSDSTTQNLSALVNWSSLTPGVGVVSSTGLATGVATGGFTARATYSGFSGTLTLTVTSAVLQSITVTPVNTTIINVLGNSVQFTATGHYSDGSTEDLTNTVHWAIVSGIIVGSISQTGKITPLGIGLGTVTATFGTIVGSTGFLVVSV